MAFDFYAACNALALRFAPGTIATPSGEEAMRKAYGQAPNGAPMTPCVVIQPQDGELIYGGGTKSGQYRVDAQFHLAKKQGDFPRLETSRQKWLPVLLAATDGQMTLGMGSGAGGPVQKAIATSWDFAVLTYGSAEYDGIVIHFTIWTVEPVTLVP